MQADAASNQIQPNDPSSDQGQVELNYSLNDRPLGDIEDQYASEPEEPVQLSGTIN